MSDNNIKDLINRLKALRTEENEVILLLERAISTAHNKTEGNAVSAAKAVIIEDGPDPTPEPSFKKGDRVEITNLPVRKALGLGFSRATTDQDRRALVTDITGERQERIWVFTDNKERTWRLAKNLRHL
jgi:hypothetical protein